MAWRERFDRLETLRHRFNFRGDPNPHWNGVTECEVLVVELHRRFSVLHLASGSVGMA